MKVDALMRCTLFVLATWSMIACAGLMLCGCKQQKAVVKQQQVSVAPTRNETSPFEMAIRFLNSLDQYQPEQVRLEILSNLREWARQEPNAPGWTADPMYSRLPRELKTTFTVDRLRTNEFEQHDALVLQEAIWLRDVAKNVASKRLYNQEMLDWLDTQLNEEGLTPAQADDLSLAYRLFDWTVRSIQQDRPNDPDDVLGDAKDPSALRHVYSPWENLLQGHGDWIERSRLFILLTRQLGIHTVMLLAQRGDGEPPQPWVPAVMVDDRLYLFDPLLGIPLPDGNGIGIGELTDYGDHPELLERLRAGGAHYRIGGTDLQNVVAAVDATPAALSQRMKQIETRLQGDRKMVLTVTPTPLASRLRQHQYISNVEIWTLPYRGYQFLMEYSRDPRQAAAVLKAMQEEQRPFATRTSLMQGRLLHLRGVYRGDADNPGATKHYMDSRPSKKEMASFSVPLELVPKDSPVLASLPEDPVRRKQMYEYAMRNARALAVMSKDLATHWLGLMAMEKQEFRVAADYFRRVISAEPPSRFRQSANYNLARALEAMGLRDEDTKKIQEAISLYEGDVDTPQYVGNQIRADRLKTQLGN